MKKRLLILGMIFTMVVSSAGCGSSSSDNAGKTDQSKQTADVQDSQKDTSSSDKSDNKNDTSYKSADEITMDDLMSHDETPAEDFEFNDSTDEIVIDKYIGKDPIMVIPDEINGKKVVSLGTYALANDKNIVAIKIGNNIKDLGEGVFGNCENLRYVVLGDSVKTIGCDPFLNTNIQEVTLNDGLQKIGEDDINNTVDAPSKNIGMDLKIPESVTEMHLRDFHLIVKAGSYAEQYAKEYAESKSVYEIALDISEGLARAACAGEVNGEVVDLRTQVSEDCELNILTANDEKGLAALRHTASHVLAEAVKNLYPEAKLAIGPSIDTGFYYDFDHESFSREELDALEKEMKKIIKKGAKIQRYTMPREEAIKFMEEKGEDYKVELIKDLPEGEEISFYSQGDFVDLCAGPHLMSTKGVKAFKLISSSGAYWRGDEKNKMLSRIYGTAFSKKDELNEYLEQLEEAKKRDHNKLGREMGLFTTVDVIGQGLPLLMPKGVIMLKELQRWIEDLEDNEWGYVRTKTPLMAKNDLYKISGHWDHYKEGMFVLGDEEKDKEVFALRPMTCPFQYYVYKANQHSYRELPIRYGETSTLFRNEDSGEMHGLTRVRQFTISEGHLIVRPDQMVEECIGKTLSGNIRCSRRCYLPFIKMGSGK